MDIASIMKKDIVFLGLKADSREQVLDVMIDGMAAAGYIRDKAVYHRAVNEREAKGTTAIGFGVAIPHGKSDGVAAPCVAFARLSTPVEWKSFDGKPVDTVFLIGVPEKNAGNDHLKILIAISKKLMHEDFREELRGASTPEDILAILRAVDE